jgi:hypothetical protein
MSTVLDSIKTIEKDLLEAIQFPQQEVLATNEQIEKRKYEAKRAMKLGSSFDDKVKIVFEDVDGRKMLEGIVWGVTDKYLMLKRGMALPLHRIHEIII